MKNFILFTVLLMFYCTNSVFAQKSRDTSRYNLGGTEFIIISDESSDGKGELKVKQSDKMPSDFKYWSGIDFGINGFFWDDDKFNGDPENPFMNLDLIRSWNINLNLAEYTTELIGDKFLVTTGFGFRFNRYAFSSEINTLKYNDSTVFAEVDSSKNLRTNFLNASYLSVPIFFTLVPGKEAKKSFHLSTGIIGNLRLGSRVKQKYEQNDQKFKEIARGNYNLSPFVLDAHVRMGVGRFSIYATYGLINMFERNIGPENYRQFSIGLTSRL